MDSELFIPWWRAIAALVVAAVLGGVVVYLVVRGDTDDADDAPAVATALDGLATQQRDVTVVLSDGPLRDAPGAPPPSTQDGVLLYEQGVVNFADGEASTVSGQTGEDPDPNQGPAVSVEVEAFISNNGTKITTPWVDMWPTPLEGLEDVWVLDAALPVGTVDTTITSAGALLDMVENRDVFGDANSFSPGVWVGELDLERAAEIDSARRAELDADLLEIVDADLAEGIRATPTGSYAVTLDDGEVEVLRVEYRAGDVTFTMSWFFEPATQEVREAPEVETVPYAQWRTAFDATFTIDEPVGGDPLPPGAVLEGVDPDFTVEEIQEIFGQEAE